MVMDHRGIYIAEIKLLLPVNLPGPHSPGRPLLATFGREDV